MAPLLPDVVGSMYRTRGIIHENRFTGGNGFLQLQPFNGFIGHISLEVVALFWGLLRLYRDCVFKNYRVILMGFTSIEAIEVVKP